MAKSRKNKQTPKEPKERELLEAKLAEAEEEASEPEQERQDDASEQEGDVEQQNEDEQLSEAARTALAEGDTDEAEAEGDVAAAHLGTERYVIAGFFAAGMLLAYVTGKLIHGVWATVSNKDWFSRTLPALAAVGDDEKLTYGTIIGGIVALVIVLRTYRNSEVRTWSDEVATELAKVKWPNKKEVTNSTFVVITATTVATLYLALLDRFWAFVTNIVYGNGS